MITKKEQERLVFEKVKEVSDCIKAACGEKPTKKNFKQLVAQALDKCLKNYPDCDISVSQAQRLKAFFEECKDFLSHVITEGGASGNLRVVMFHDNDELCRWTAPIEMFFTDVSRTEYFVALVTNGLKNAVEASFLHPEARKLIMEGDERAISFMYRALDRPNGQSVLNNLIMLRDRFPDFYKHITEKLDVMTVEAFQQHAEDKDKGFVKE